MMKNYNQEQGESVFWCFDEHPKIQGNIDGHVLTCLFPSGCIKLHVGNHTWGLEHRSLWFQTSSDFTELSPLESY